MGFLSDPNFVAPRSVSSGNIKALRKSHGLAVEGDSWVDWEAWEGLVLAKRQTRLEDPSTLPHSEEQLGGWTLDTDSAAPLWPRRRLRGPEGGRLLAAPLPTPLQATYTASCSCQE